MNDSAPVAPQNRYFSSNPVMRDRWPPGLAEVVDAAWRGELRPSDLRSFHVYPAETPWNQRPWVGNRDYTFSDPRKEFIKACGFVLPTVPFLDALARLLAGHRVLEVCAGKGHLVQSMRDRGLAWEAVDAHPAGPLVARGSALETARAALASGRADAIFAAWVPLGSNLDVRLCALGAPVVLVGEPPGGCTGTEDLTDGVHFRYASDVVPGWVDPCQWEGLHDVAMLSVGGWPWSPADEGVSQTLPVSP